MIYRTLGSTGQKVSAIGIGGSHLSQSNVDERLAIRIIRTAIDNGITFMDNSWDYSNGQSELRLSKALRDGYRQKAFVMTKVDGRTKQEASKQLDDSLKRLNVGHIDLVQHHEIIRYEDPDRIFDSDGANEALIRARDAGKIRYIGFTGHKDPHVHLYMLEVAEKFGFKFDTVQLPLNVMDAHFRSFANLVLPRLVMHNIGILGMKPLANGAILKSKKVTAIECLHYALNLPTSVVITGIDSLEILNQALEAVTTYYPFSEDELSDLLAKTADAGSTGKFEPYKTTSIFDSTAYHPQWLGEEPQKVRELVSV